MDQNSARKARGVSNRARPSDEQSQLRSLQSHDWRKRAPLPKQGGSHDPMQKPLPKNHDSERDTGTRDRWRGRDWQTARLDKPLDSVKTAQRLVSGSFGNNPRTTRDSAGNSKALAEGRRIYIGNMLYHIRPEQLTAALEANGFPEIEEIHISVDPVSGRNPGYCFVEFETREAAEAAIRGMAGVEIEGRPLKTGPCKPDRRSATGNAPSSANQGKATFERWGNWNTGHGRGDMVATQGPNVAEEHLIEVVDGDMRCRVFVGGLGKSIDQAENAREIQALFKDFEVVAHSKRITARESSRMRPGKHNYAFVDFASEDEAEAAVGALDGRIWQGSRLKVRHARVSNDIAERGTRWDTDLDAYRHS